MDKYRYDDAYGKLYKYSGEHDAYLFVCGNPYNLSEDELIEEYENSVCHLGEINTTPNILMRKNSGDTDVKLGTSL